MKLRPLNIHLTLKVLGILMAGFFLFGPARVAAAPETWQADAAREAAEEGYWLIELKELAQLLSDQEAFILLDVRPDYEYQAAHLPGAINLEFHLGDRSRLSPAKQAALEKNLGPDRAVKVVIYCRSYS